MMYMRIKIGIKNFVRIVLFGIVLQHDLLAMIVEMELCTLPVQSSGSPTAAKAVDQKDLELALEKMLNFESWLELYYSIQAIITPYKGTSDRRIQKYVEKWALSLEQAHKITEQVVGITLKSLCVSKKIDLNKPDTTGFLPITLAVYQNDPFVTRVLIAAGVDVGKKDRLGHDALALARRFRYDSICREFIKV